MSGRQRSWARGSAWRARLAIVSAIATVVGACGTSITVPGLAGAVPRCEDVPQIEAGAGLYRDTPIYVANEMPTDEVLAWASTKPGFEELWIDREHLGWVTVAFSQDVDARQAELAREFPAAGVVAVSVAWTMDELKSLQQEVMTNGRPIVTSSGIRSNRGVVSIGLRVLEPELVAEIEAKFGGRRVCVEGMDPADAPVQGPQLPKGDGWRLVADQDGVGEPYQTGIAADPEAYAALWAEIGLAGAPPAVDFETEVAIWFGAVHGSSCPRLRLDNVVIDIERVIVYSAITELDVGGCTADAIGHAYVVAVERAGLPHGPFTIQLSDDPPPGVIDGHTIVDTDLSIPGSTVTPDQLHSAPPVVEELRVESGDFFEPGYEFRYRFPVRCGIEWLGELNSVWWRTDAAGGIPPQWQPEVAGDQTIDLGLMLQVEPEPAIMASANGHTVVYRPSPGKGPGCS